MEGAREENKRIYERQNIERLDKIANLLERINENLYFIERHLNKEKLPFEPCDD